MLNVDWEATWGIYCAILLVLNFCSIAVLAKKSEEIDMLKRVIDVLKKEAGE